MSHEELNNQTRSIATQHNLLHWVDVLCEYKYTFIIDIVTIGGSFKIAWKKKNCVLAMLQNLFVSFWASKTTKCFLLSSCFMKSSDKQQSDYSLCYGKNETEYLESCQKQNKQTDTTISPLYLIWWSRSFNISTEILRQNSFSNK